MTDKPTMLEYLLSALSGFMEAFLYVVLVYCIFTLGRAYEQVKNERTIVASGRCEYRSDAKTGVTRLVWTDTGEPVENGE